MVIRYEQFKRYAEIITKKYGNDLTMKQFHEIVRSWGVYAN